MKKAGVVIMSFLAVSCTGLDRHIHDTLNPYGTPNTPDSHSETAQRVRGAKLSTIPILPETGDVWPGQPEPVPSLQDVSRSNEHFIEKWRKAQPQLEEDLKQQLADGQGMAVGEDVGKQYGSGKEVVPIGKPITSHVHDNAPPYLEPVNRGIVTIPNGDGTDTLIAPDGSVKIVSRDKAALFQKAKTFHQGAAADAGGEDTQHHDRGDDASEAPQQQPQSQPQKVVEAEQPRPQPKKDVVVVIPPPPPPQPKEPVAAERPQPHPQPRQDVPVEPPHSQPRRDVVAERPRPQSQPQRDVVVEQPQPKKEVVIVPPPSHPQPKEDVVVELPHTQAKEDVVIKPSRHKHHREEVVVDVPDNATVSVKPKAEKKKEHHHAHERHEEAERHQAVAEKHRHVPEKHREKAVVPSEKKHHSHRKQSEDFVDMMGYGGQKAGHRSHHHDDGGVYQFDWDK